MKKDRWLIKAFIEGVIEGFIGTVIGVIFIALIGAIFGRKQIETDKGSQKWEPFYFFRKEKANGRSIHNVELNDI